MSSKIEEKLDDLDLEDDEEEENEETADNRIEINDSIVEKNKPQPKQSPINEEDRDEEVEDFAKQFKTIYETKFLEYLRGLKKNDPLNATSLPVKKYNKLTYEVDSMNSTTLVFYFEKLELDEKTGDAVNAVVARSFDKSELCHFQPFVCQEYGPYFNTNLYTCMYNIGRSKEMGAQIFFLDLPIDLYNLIE